MIGMLTRSLLSDYLFIFLFLEKILQVVNMALKAFPDQVHRLAQSGVIMFYHVLPHSFKTTSLIKSHNNHVKGILYLSHITNTSRNQEELLVQAIKYEGWKHSLCEMCRIPATLEQSHRSRETK